MNQHARLTSHRTWEFFNEVLGDYTFSPDVGNKESVMSRRIKLTIKDTLAFYNDAVGDYTFNPDNAQTAVYWFALPESAFDGDDLRPECQEPLLQAIYGPDWRHGNGDDSKYVVLHVRLSLPTPEEEQSAPWLAERAACLIVSEEGIAHPVGARDF
jgi:hypothetical protein